MKVRARYAVAEGEIARCRLCPNDCRIAPGRLGRCRGRQNLGGTLYAVNYGEVVSLAVDPVEKKPLYHFHPGEETFSVATYGCNLLCPFCQNAGISQRSAPSRYIAPEELVEMVQERGLGMVSYTYTEPLIWFEYLLDACRLMKAAGIRNVLVTNGMVNPEPLAELLPLVDAMNIDLKSIRPAFYRDYVKGDLATVLNTIRVAHRACHVELTTLLIPGRNDSEEELQELTGFVAGLGRSTVLHLSRYFPRHRAAEPATPVSDLVRAAELARTRLDYVYIGNAAISARFRDTRCPQCDALLVERSQYAGAVQNVAGGACSQCGRPVDIVLGAQRGGA